MMILKSFAVRCVVVIFVYCLLSAIAVVGVRGCVCLYMSRAKFSSQNIGLMWCDVSCVMMRPHKR